MQHTKQAAEHPAQQRTEPADARSKITQAQITALRNFLGPHHLRNEDDIDCLGPHDFFRLEHRTKEYRLKPAGLLGEVTLDGYRKNA